MSIQLAGFAGSNVFKAADAPRYKTGLTICGVCALTGAVIVLVWKALYTWRSKRIVQSEIVTLSAEFPVDNTDEDVDKKV